MGLFDCERNTESRDAVREIMPGALLRCPVRGALTVPERAADGLTFTEKRDVLTASNYYVVKAIL